LGFRASGFGFQFQALGFGLWVSGFGFRALGFGLWFSGFGAQALGYGLWVSGFGFRALGFGLWVSGFGFRVCGDAATSRVQGAGCRVQGAGDAQDVEAREGDQHRAERQAQEQPWFGVWGSGFVPGPRRALVRRLRFGVWSLVLCVHDLGFRV